MTHYPPASKKIERNATDLTADGESEWKGREAEIIAELTRVKCAFQLRTIVSVMGEG